MGANIEICTKSARLAPYSVILNLFETIGVPFEQVNAYSVGNWQFEEKADFILSDENLRDELGKDRIVFIQGRSSKGLQAGVNIYNDEKLEKAVDYWLDENLAVSDEGRREQYIDFLDQVAAALKAFRAYGLTVAAVGREMYLEDLTSVNYSVAGSAGVDMWIQRQSDGTYRVTKQ